MRRKRSSPVRCSPAACPRDGAGNPTVGVFLNDGSGAKLSYYLTQRAALSVGGCADDGSRELHLRLTLGSTAPARGLPAYVTGLALSGDPYTSRTNVMVFSPTGGDIVDVKLGGTEQEFGTGLERNRSVGVFTVDLPPGQSRTFDISIATAALPETESSDQASAMDDPGRAAVASDPN